MEKSPTEDELLRRAAALEAASPDEAGALYADILRRDRGNLEASNALERLGHAESFGRWMRVDCTIHPQDDIFRFIRSAPETRDPIRAYLADGWRTLSELMVLLERVDRPLLKMNNVLEFAAGFGRFTRHLAPLFPDRLTCADIIPEAVGFGRQQFGVKGLVSSFEPEDIVFPERYELVFVLSLFSHLPVSRWGEWLRCLAKAVAPGGVLVASFHGERAAQEFGVDLGPGGVRYFHSSESPSLDADQYGTCLTTRAVIEDEIEKALGRPPDFYQPTAFWIGQDAVVMKL